MRTAILTTGVILGLLSAWLWWAWPGSVPAPLFIVTLFLAGEVPAILRRMDGASGVQTAIVAILVPLFAFEGLLAWSALANRGLGGDLQGIELDLMLPTVGVTALVGGLVAFIDCKVIPRRR